MNTFEARYPGRCANCDDDIDPGEFVAYVDDELVHLACGSQQLYQSDRPQLTEPDVCDRCWTARAANGACACE